jgi:hypothetical protein
VDQPTDQQPTANDQRPLTEEFQYSRHSAQQHQRPTNNMLELWQNLAPFGDRPIGGAVEALLTNVVNRQSSVSPIVIFFETAADIVITQPNSV